MSYASLLHPNSNSYLHERCGRYIRVLYISVKPQSLTMSKGYFPISDRKMLYLDQLFLNLITASHILHKHDIFDAYGHVSVRNPDNLSNFFMSSNMAPALLKSADEIVEYKVEDAAPVNDNALPGFVERYIHSEIYKKFPNINAVVHSHCQDVLPYCISDIPLRPTIHMGGFLGKFSVFQV